MYRLAMKNRSAAPSLPAGEWDGIPMPRRIWAILAVAFGVSLSVLDATIANVALPSMAAAFGISPSDSVWIVNVYQLATVVSLLTFSTLGDIVGYRRVYLCGLTLFVVSSAACALAPSFGWLVGARISQGFGAAALTGVNTSLIRTIYPRNRLGRGMGINATVVAVSSVAGPSLAAAVLSVASWPWLFAVNLPVGIAAIFFSARYLPRNPVRSSSRLDWRDSLMNALTFGLLIFSIEGYAHGVSPSVVALMAVAFVAAGTFFVRSQLRKPWPMLPFDLLRKPIFAVSVGTSVCSYTAQMLAMVTLPFMLQHDMGMSEVTTGLCLTAWPAIIMVVAPVAGLLIERVHAGALGGAGLLIMSAGLVALGFLPAQPAVHDIVWRLMLCGCGFGLFQSPNNSIIIASAPRERSGSASGMLASARLVGQSSGAALAALLLHILPAGSTHAALWVAAAFALAGSVTGFSRLSLRLPDGLR